MLMCLLRAQIVPAQPPSPDPDTLPVSIDRIHHALARAPAITPREQHPVFRVQVFGRKGGAEDFLGKRFWEGPVPFGGMTHADFMNMVAPPGFQYTSGMNATPVILWLIKEVRAAKHRHDEAAARLEVAEALAALEKARADAGLPDKE
ncbi:MAG: hypothetical protein DMF85_11995 [Acidobacteria bacterium]|nr:MAG: hypothetical protein DMF85_11995 [Acidobacteriota bacterium]